MATQKQKHSLAQAIFALLAANPGLLVPAKWHVRVIRIRAIDPYRARMQLVRNLDGARDILRKYRGSQTIQRVVRLAQYVVFVLKPDDDANRPENLLLDNAHVWPRLSKDGRLDPEALRAMSLAPEVNLGALLLTRVDITHDALHYLPISNSKISKEGDTRTSNWIWDT